jgi:hypothetical protein
MGTMRMQSFKNFIYERIEWKQLEHIKLVKNPSRGDIFLKKIKNGEAHAVIGGQFIIDPSLLSTFEKLMQSTKLPRIGRKQAVQVSGKLNGISKTITYPQDFYKTTEYGGKGEGSGTKAEDASLAKFQEELLRVLQKEGRTSIPLRIGRNRTILMADIVQPKGTPKSDFNIVDRKGMPVGFISHKDPTLSASGEVRAAGQQYGGLTDDATKGVFRRNRELANFIATMILDHQEEHGYRKDAFAGLYPGESYSRRVTDKKVIMQSIFGVDYGGRPGLNNVDEYHVGDMKLVKKGNAYIITSRHTLRNGQLPKGGYEAYYHARYTGDMNPTIQGIKFSKTRFGVYAKMNLPGTTEYI